MQLCQTEWDSALENGELTKLRDAYSNQLEEQVALAKLDIVNALQEQIQVVSRLTSICLVKHNSHSVQHSTSLSLFIIFAKFFTPLSSHNYPRNDVHCHVP